MSERNWRGPITLICESRRSRWAALIGLAAFSYIASFGPACWISSRSGRGLAAVDFLYQPLMQIWWRGAIPHDRDLLQRYARSLANTDAGQFWYIGRDEQKGFYTWNVGYR